MRCTILAIGTRGDVQPLVALGVGLREAGVDVRLATHRDFESLVVGHGLEFFPLAGQATQFFAGAAGHAFRERLRKPKEFRRFFESYLAMFYTKFLEGAWQACQGADVVIAIAWGAASLAERLRVPVFVASVTLGLHLPTWAFPNPFQDAPPIRLGWLTNRISWWRAGQAGRLGLPRLNDWRTKTLGLTPTTWGRELRALRRLPHLCGYSPIVLPRPFDWPRWIHLTGYWFLKEPQGEAPTAELRSFLEEGAPPIAIGFSSQVGRNAAATTRAVVDAVERTGERAVIVTGFGGLKGVALPPSMHAVPAVPYDWLLPRVRALVHHGGAGSTALALGAGLPNVITYFGYDQKLWGERVHALGAGPAPIPADRLTAESLAAAIHEATTSPRMRERALGVAAAIAREDGVKNAVDLVLAAAGR